MMRRLVVGCAALALACVVNAAEDLLPAVNTSAPERAPSPAAVTPAKPAAASSTPVAPASVRQTPKPVTPAASPGAGNPGSGTGGSARDRVELEDTQITGNRELPKVMYVVPWKRPELGDYGNRPGKTLLDEMLEPVDREVFRRQNRYFESLQSDAQAPRSGDGK